MSDARGARRADRDQPGLTPDRFRTVRGDQVAHPAYLRVRPGPETQKHPAERRRDVDQRIRTAGTETIPRSRRQDEFQTPDHRLRAARRTGCPPATSSRPQRPAVIDGEAEFPGQAMQHGIARRRCSRPRAIGRMSSTAPGSSPANGLEMTLRTASPAALLSSRPAFRQRIVQVRQVPRRKSAQLKVATVGQVDLTVAPATRPSRDPLAPARHRRCRR